MGPLRPDHGVIIDKFLLEQDPSPNHKAVTVA